MTWGAPPVSLEEIMDKLPIVNLTGPYAWCYAPVQAIMIQQLIEKQRAEKKRDDPFDALREQIRRTRERYGKTV